VQQHSFVYKTLQLNTRYSQDHQKLIVKQEFQQLSLHPGSFPEALLLGKKGGVERQHRITKTSLAA